PLQLAGIFVVSVGEPSGFGKNLDTLPLPYSTWMVLAFGSKDLMVTKAEQLAASARAVPRAITAAHEINETASRMNLLLGPIAGGGVGTLPETGPEVDAETTSGIQGDVARSR